MFLTFNEKLKGQGEFVAEDVNRDAIPVDKDLPLRYTWNIWEQVMQSTEGKAGHYSDATHKVASFTQVQEFWALWNHMPQPSELLEQKRMVREFKVTQNFKNFKVTVKLSTKTKKLTQNHDSKHVEV